MGRQLSQSASTPEPVTIPIEDNGSITGIGWFPGETGILLLHDRGMNASADSWGDWPDRLAQAGYAVLAVDLPEDTSIRQIEATVSFLRDNGTAKLFIIAAGETVALLDVAMADAFVLIAPLGDQLDPLALGAVPKLVVAGSADAVEYAAVERFARGCRGWSLLSTFATENTLAALLDGRHAQQIGSQIAGFLQEFRTPSPSQPAPRASRPGSGQRTSR